MTLTRAYAVEIRQPFVRAIVAAELEDTAEVRAQVEIMETILGHGLPMLAEVIAEVAEIKPGHEPGHLREELTTEFIQGVFNRADAAALAEVVGNRVDDYGRPLDDQGRGEPGRTVSSSDWEKYGSGNGHDGLTDHWWR
jgi:hypothetical protein